MNSGPRVHVFDFGQNLTGVCRLKIRGRRGQIITLKFAEMLKADGHVYRENLRAAKARPLPRHRSARNGGDTWGISCPPTRTTHPGPPTSARCSTSTKALSQKAVRQAPVHVDHLTGGPR